MNSTFTKIGLVIGFLGAVLGMLAAVNPMGLAQLVNFKNSQILPFIVLGFAMVLTAAIVGPLLFQAVSNTIKEKKLLKVGVRATAKILSIRDTGVTINKNPYVTITVEIKPQVTASFNLTVSRVFIPRPGDEMEIIYDPSNPTIAMAAKS